jgi:hypothetical protein
LSTYTWRDIDFRPVATPGWRVIFLDSPTGWSEAPLAGWLIQEEIEKNDWEGSRPTGSRRVVAAFMADDYEAESTATTANFWMVLGPGENDPTPELEAEHRSHL